MKFLIAFFLLTFLTSCSYVVSKYPVGIENYTTTADEWNGTWLNENEIIKIHVTDESTGLVQLAWIDHSQNGFKFESITCQIKKGKNWIYANVLEMPNEKIGGYYFWGRLKKEDRKILIWLPSAEAFRKAAEAKQIDAIVDATHSTKLKMQTIKSVKLLDNPEKIVTLVENSGSDYFDWEDPIVLIKTK